jgi:hypothetical protein
MDPIWDIPHKPSPTVDNSYLDDRPFRLLTEEEIRSHPKASIIPQGIPLDLAQSILFGLALTDKWNHPDDSYVVGKGFKFTTHSTESNVKTSLRDGDDLLHGIVMSAAVYENDPVEYLRANKALHTISKVLVRQTTEEEEGYLIGLQPPSVQGASDGRAFISFAGTMEWNHVKQALHFLPGTINGVPALSTLGCHAGYQQVADKIPNVIEALQQQGYEEIILCGHSRGGAIAHLVLLMYLYRNGIIDDKPAANNASGKDASPPKDKKKKLATPKIRSMAFGSPFIFNEAVSVFLNDRGLHYRFINVVNDGDVVPGAMSHLGGLSTQDLVNLTGKSTGIDVNTILNTIGPLLGAATGYPLSTVLGATVGGILWNAFFNRVVQSPIQTYRPIGELYCNTTNVERVSKFPLSRFPGKYIFLRKKYGFDSRTGVGKFLHGFLTFSVTGQ